MLQNTVFSVIPFNWFSGHLRITNVEAAKNAGMVGLQFKNADTLKEDLSLLGIGLVTQDN